MEGTAARVKAINNSCLLRFLFGEWGYFNVRIEKNQAVFLKKSFFFAGEKEEAGAWGD